MYYNHREDITFWESYDDAYHYDYEEGQEVADYDVEAYLRAGFDLAEAHHWLGIRRPIIEAMAFANLGVTPEEASAFRTTPAKAYAFKRAGFTIETARPWLVYGFAAEEADVWSRAGWVPEQAAHLNNMYADAHGAATAWAFTGLSPLEAIERAEDCQSPLPFLTLSNCAPPELETMNCPDDTR